MGLVLKPLDGFHFNINECQIALEVRGNETCSRLFLVGTMNDIGHYASNQDDGVTGGKAQFIYSNDDV